jgi:hypothetical protein
LDVNHILFNLELSFDQEEFAMFDDELIVFEESLLPMMLKIPVASAADINECNGTCVTSWTGDSRYKSLAVAGV